MRQDGHKPPVAWGTLEAYVETRRKDLGWSRRVLADHAGIDYSYLVKIVTGRLRGARGQRYRLSAETLNRLSDAFGDSRAIALALGGYLHIGPKDPAFPAEQVLALRIARELQDDPNLVQLYELYRSLDPTERLTAVRAVRRLTL